MRSGTPLFVGERLRQAREARGVNQVVLGEMLGLTRQAISQYEQGKSTPAPTAMERMGAALGLPLHFFTKPMLESAPQQFFFRSMSAATKTSRQRVARRAEWVDEILRFAERLMHLPQATFPALGAANPFELSDSDIEDAADSLRMHLKVGDGPISNLVWLLENHGGVVVRAELGDTKLDALSTWLPSADRPTFILGTDKASAVRSRFDAAHELGHIVLHRDVPRETMERIVAEPAKFKRLESQAHRFAAAFLLPSGPFVEEASVLTLDGLRGLKSRWQVSIGMMIHRVATLNLTSEEGVRRLWMNYARRGWRRREPLDDQLKPEQPMLLRRVIEMLIEERAATREDILHELALAPFELEALVGVPHGYFSDQVAQVRALPVKFKTENAIETSPATNLRGIVIPFGKRPG
jgi:Zn-dependent peptidase ImmA (M78 family)/DNA-binding XRE family transcriptional regulator